MVALPTSFRGMEYEQNVKDKAQGDGECAVCE